MLAMVGACVFAAVLCGCLAVRRPARRNLRSLVGPAPDGEAVLPDAGDVVKRPGRFFARLEAEAQKAGLDVRGRQFAAVAAVSAALAFVASLVLVRSAVVAVFCSGVGLFAPRWWLEWQKRRRAASFAALLDGALSLMSSSLRAGGSLAQAIERVGTNVADPVGAEFRKADRAVRLGATPAEALAAVRDRVDCADLDLVVVATRILARTGGNLAEVYDFIADTVRERRAFRRSLAALTSQVRLSGTVVSLLPVGVTALVWMISPGYFDSLLSTSGGRVLFWGCYVLIGVGWLVVRRMSGAPGD